MIKKSLNQNSKYIEKFVDFIEPNYIFDKKPINRLNNTQATNGYNQNKLERLTKLKIKINSIQDCNIKNNSNNLIISEGDINSPIMIIGEAPGVQEENLGLPFQSDSGVLLNKMLLAINIKRDKTYLTYTINFRPPEDRKPTGQEIKRYSIFLSEHISIINPKLLILMGSTAMEAVTSLKNRISNERGKWKEIIINNKTYPAIITFSPSYLLRFPENKKYSWDDLKKIRKKIQDLSIKI